VVGTERVLNKTAGGWTVYILRVTPRGGGGGGGHVHSVWLTKHRYSDFVRLFLRLVTAGAGNSLPACWAELETESARNPMQLLYSTERARKGRCELVSRCFKAAVAVDPGFTEHALVRRFLRPQSQGRQPPSSAELPRGGGGNASDINIDSGGNYSSVAAGGGAFAAGSTTTSSTTRAGSPAGPITFSLTEDPKPMWQRVSGVAGGVVSAASAAVDAVTRTGAAATAAAAAASAAEAAAAADNGASVRLLLDYPTDRSVAEVGAVQVQCT
jgi:hypothetical protein